MAGGIEAIGQGLSLPLLDGVAGGLGGAGGAGAAGGSESSGAVNFGEMLRGKLGELQESQHVAESEATALATGQTDDIARSMMKVEQANVSLQLATQLRNKAIEAYQEILRMQM
jgi:flagellar hook-basal body complex protein FliE